MLRSILDDAGIPYFIRNDTFGSLYLGRYAEAYNRKVLCVSRVDREEATILVREFLHRTGTGGEAPGDAADEPRPPRLLAGLLTWLERWLDRAEAGAGTGDDLRGRLRVIRNDAPCSAEATDEASEPPRLRIV